MKAIFALFKLRIGVVITWTALAAVSMTPGSALTPAQMLVLGLSVLIASASAGAFNQYVEHDLDRQMSRTRGRPFAAGRLVHDARWVWLIMALLAGSVAAAGYALNPLTALHVFLGAFFYAIVYTVWLKRRTWWNIVIGGLAGSFAVLAGAAAAGLYRMLAPLAADDVSIFTEPLTDRSRAALEREKSLVLRSIKELEFDHAMRKVSDADYAAIGSRLRARALDLMRELDQEPAASRDGAADDTPVPDDTQSRATAVPAGVFAQFSEPGLARPVCGVCGMENDADARFCKQCGGRIA